MSRVTRSRRPAAAALVRLTALTLILAAALPGAARSAPPVRAATEGDLATEPAARRLAAFAAELASTSRVAGSADAAAASSRIAATMRSFGLQVEVHEHTVFLPHARSVRVERRAPDPMALQLNERELSADPGASAWSYPAAAGYSAAGRVEGPVVYANYGRPQDFGALAALNVDLRGKVVVIRYGGVFRGAKVRRAEQEGAAAVVLYSDPQDDGFFRGEVYPNGPFRPGSGVQRGSVRVGRPGDPATPGQASPTPEATRRPLGTVDGMPAIPVVALGYAAAAELLRGLDGVEVPLGWQGGLPFRYHVTGSVTARVEVTLDDTPYKVVRNVVGTIVGARRPDQQVIVGAHYDSWTPGAVDNVSGVAAMLEAARVVAARARAGAPPARTIRFAAWDGEEWGLIGSTEWVESRMDELAAGGVAYVNLDGIAGGPFFAAMASPALRAVLRDVTRQVADPTVPAMTVHDGWLRRSGDRGGEPPVGLPSGGSDQTAFSAIVGMPVVGFGFGGASGVYHSAYDSVEFMRRFGDPGFRQHRAVAALTALLAWRLADAELLPLDYREQARELAVGLNRVDQELERRRAGAGAATAPAWVALTRFADAAAIQAARGHAALRRVSEGAAWRAFRAANRHLIGVERRFTYDRGVEGRWWRNLAYAPHTEDAYAAEALPGLIAALRDGDLRALALELGALERALEAATAELAAATSNLSVASQTGRVASWPIARGSHTGGR